MTIGLISSLVSFLRPERTNRYELYQQIRYMTGNHLTDGQSNDRCEGQKFFLLRQDSNSDPIYEVPIIFPLIDGITRLTQGIIVKFLQSSYDFWSKLTADFVPLYILNYVPTGSHQAVISDDRSNFEEGSHFLLRRVSNSGLAYVCCL